MDLKQELLSKIKINEDTQCWEWQKTKSRNYGRMKIDGKLMMAHRLSYTVFVGEIPDKMLICHHCDNPSCINPKHLFIGTYKDNYNDCRNKGRLNHRGFVKQKPSKTFMGEVIRIKRALARNKSVQEIASLTSVTMGEEEIADIRDRKIYADIGTAIY